MIKDIAVDLRVAQLLCSRLCHDLAGPAGAVNAGLEALADGADVEASSLVVDSAEQITKRLAFFRVAFGAGGGGETAAQARDLALDLLHDSRVDLDWPSDVVLAATFAPGGVKLILNLILVGVDCLPRGGSLSVRFADLSEGTGVAVTAAGQAACVRDDIQAAMIPDAAIGDLTARNVHGYLTALLAKSFGHAVEISQCQQDEMRLAVVITALK